MSSHGLILRMKMIYIYQSSRLVSFLKEFRNYLTLIKKKGLTSWLENDLLIRFENKIIEIDFNIIKEWGSVLGANERIGIKIPVVDSLIGVTALVNNFTLVTRNVRDFESINCNLKNLWTSE